MLETANQYKYSVVIPVYNSQGIVGETIDRTVAFFENQQWDYELILVNDNSPDNSWTVVAEKARHNPQIKAINLLKNYGQHTAMYCGLRYMTGDYAITIDDDLQNPPEEIVHMVDKVLEGYDIVYGQFRRKEHAGYRRAGSRAVALINRRVFRQPKDLIVSNFRIIRRDVVERMVNYRTNYPYITGLSLMFSTNRANTLVEHQPRKVGRSNYNFIRIATLVMRILFNYSAYPLRVVSLVGFAVAILSFLAGVFYLLRAIFIGTEVAGWATVVVLLAFLSGVNIIIVSMLGEYLIRLVQQMSESHVYYVKEVING
ncbi:MAG: glycosyltransferase family 2 protein [Anaerolineae bacterium]|nr:glycosyltransferase family 2 protein [Anaerolineae bacterium]